jgi:hypothetical protein
VTKKKIMSKTITTESQFLLYTTEDGHQRIEVMLDNNTVWLNQTDLTELFQTTKQNISLHLRNIYTEGELSRESTVKEYLTVRREGKRQISRGIEYYNLEAIIAVGYRVRSHRGTQFRQWATERLNEFLIKGFVLDDERLKEGRHLGTDYFDELLERIRDIRASEKRFYQKIRDIYKLAVDYDPKAEETLEFFSIVQNKLHFAISGKTAAELIAERADSSRPNMGLTSWKGSRVRKHDVTIAKNYLNKDELDQLNRIVVTYLDYAEDHAMRRRQIFMRNWREKLDAFLQFNERDILTDAGKVSKAVADRLALEQYEIFHAHRLSHEADAEALEDDAELRRITHTIDKKKRGE